MSICNQSKTLTFSCISTSQSCPDFAWWNVMWYLLMKLSIKSPGFDSTWRIKIWTAIKLVLWTKTCMWFIRNNNVELFPSSHAWVGSLRSWGWIAWNSTSPESLSLHLMSSAGNHQRCVLQKGTALLKVCMYRVLFGMWYLLDAVKENNHV